MTEERIDCAAREIAQLMEDIREKDGLIDAFELELAQALNKDAEIDRLKTELEQRGVTLGLVIESRDKTEGENENLYLLVDLTEARCKELLEEIARIRRKIQREATNDRH